MGKAETGGQGRRQPNKGLYVREGFWPARLRTGLGSSVWQEGHGLVQAACWAQHPSWRGGLSAGSRLSGVLRPSGLGRSERDRESLTSIFLGCGQSQKSLPLRGSPSITPCPATTQSGGPAVAPGGTEGEDPADRWPTRVTHQTQRKPIATGPDWWSRGEAWRAGLFFQSY